MVTAVEAQIVVDSIFTHLRRKLTTRLGEGWRRGGCGSVGSRCARRGARTAGADGGLRLILSAVAASALEEFLKRRRWRWHDDKAVERGMRETTQSQGLEQFPVHCATDRLVKCQGLTVIDNLVHGKPRGLRSEHD